MRDFLKHLYFRVRWACLSEDDQLQILAQTELDLAAYHYDNAEQYYAALHRGESFNITWRDLYESL